MVDILERPSAEFADAAAQPTPRRSVTIDIDSDLIQYLQTERLNLAEHINGLLRFHMDTSMQREREADLDGWEPGEMIEPPPMVPEF